MDGFGHLSNPDKNDLWIGYYSPMNVSINTNQPGYGNLGVGGNIAANGNLTANGNLYLGAASTETAKINIFTSGAALVSKTNHSVNYGYNTQLIINRNFTKALALRDDEISNPALRETFLVYGNGSTTINSDANTSTKEVFAVNSANTTNTYERQFTIFADGGTAIGGMLNGVGGINKLPSGYKLSVNGKIIAEEVLVALRANWPWPDYVFNHNYKLKSIDELETYIKSNQHLPNIPSAAEMQAGIETGKMMTLQMEKIEELTLYIIEQNKKILEQEKRLKALEEKLK